MRILNIDPSPEKIAQEVVLKDSAFLQYIINDDNDLPYRNEIFTIERIRESDLTEANKLQCANQNCYRVEMYNFGIDVSSRAIVDITAKKVISVQHLRSFQPNIPLRLKMIALKIALESPEVKAELGYDPTEEDALMVDTKTSLNKSKCQRSKHLCVAPTFVKGDRALWCIVDLTDFK
ncbi:MAG: hypothetical protein KBA06_01935, partial [Saprospiraceae bacterium]|nr:hypothetical protein [Saprospiraceae bacterium]